MLNRWRGERRGEIIDDNPLSRWQQLDRRDTFFSRVFYTGFAISFVILWFALEAQPNKGPSAFLYNSGPAGHYIIDGLKLLLAIGILKFGEAGVLSRPITSFDWLVGNLGLLIYCFTPTAAIVFYNHPFTMATAMVLAMFGMLIIWKVFRFDVGEQRTAIEFAILKKAHERGKQ